VIESDVEALRRAHELFAGRTRRPTFGSADYSALLRRGTELNGVVQQSGYQRWVDRSRESLLAAQRTDAAAARVIAGAHQDRAQAHALTKSVLDEARADAVATPTTPMASVRRYAAMSRGCMRNGRMYWSPGCARDGG